MLNCIDKPVFGEKEFLSFLMAQGIDVKTNTRARGNLGICFKNRIDISKKVVQDRRLSVLMHEYAHKVHYDIEKDCVRKGGSLEKLFNVENTEEIRLELVKVTQFVDENANFIQFKNKKPEIFCKIKEQENIIKKLYPEFKRSADFKPAVKFLKNSPAKYLLRYDNVKIIHPVFRKETIYSITSIDKDFPDMPPEIKAYIRLKSSERHYKRLYRAKNKAEKYYNKPTELFARFAEGLLSDHIKIAEIAPTTYLIFSQLLEQGYYGNLKELFKLADIKLTF
jgi:hypothetical protein